MRFASPWWLLALLPALAAAAASFWHVERRRARLAYPDAGGLAAAEVRRRLLVRGTPAAMTAAALLLAAVALARPQRISRHALGPAEGIDIMMALDTSTSMLALDFDPEDRMTAAKKAARAFILGRVSDRIGLVVFGGAPLLSCPLTLDYDALTGFLGDVYAGMTHMEGTAIGDGIAAAVNHLKASPSPSKVIILLTDGRQNVGAADPLTAAQAARSFGIKVYAIGTGKRGPAVFPVDHPILGRQLTRIPDELDEDSLTRIAAETGGRYFRAESLEQLKEIYAEIDRLEKHRFERPQAVTGKDLYAWLLLPAALLLAGEMLLSRTLLLRIP